MILNEQIFIQLPNGNHGYGIVLISEDQKKLHNFVGLCRSEIPKDFGSFHQAGSCEKKYDTYQFFEFLLYYNNLTTMQQDEILNVCQDIASSLNMELAIM